MNITLLIGEELVSAFPISNTLQSLVVVILWFYWSPKKHIFKFSR